MSPRRHDDECIYNRLTVLRAERGLSRQDIAAALGIHYQTIGYLERGDYNPSLQLALKLAAFFALPVEAIFSLTPFTPLSEPVFPRTAAPHPPTPPPTNPPQASQLQPHNDPHWNWTRARPRRRLLVVGFLASLGVYAA